MRWRKFVPVCFFQVAVLVVMRSSAGAAPDTAASADKCEAAIAQARALKVGTSTDEETARNSAASWDSAREKCDVNWPLDVKTDYDAARRAIEWNKTVRDRKRCYAAFDAAKAIQVTAESSPTTAQVARDAWETAKTVCATMWTTERADAYAAVLHIISTPADKKLCAETLYEILDAGRKLERDEAFRNSVVLRASRSRPDESPSSLLLDAKRSCRTEKERSRLALAEQRVAKIEAKVNRERTEELGTCGVQNIVSFIIDILQRGVDPAASRGCIFEISALVVVSTTSDGWVIVGSGRAPIAALRTAELLMDGTILTQRRAGFLGMKRFTTGSGAVSVLPSFVLAPSR